jgi:hypothetical protein
VPARREQFVDLRAILVRLGREHRLAALAPDGVDDLVLEDPGEPGAQVRAPLETSFAGERRNQRLLHRVLGQARIAQLQARVAQKVRPLTLQPGPEVVHRQEFTGGLKPRLQPLPAR